jgi:hypothetical protein
MYFRSLISIRDVSGATPESPANRSAEETGEIFFDGFSEGGDVDSAQ